MEFKLKPVQKNKMTVPTTIPDFKKLELLPANILKELGCQVWQGKHWLYPGDWYDSIPDGLTIVDINGIEEEFKHGFTDNDTHFGALAYGFISKLN